MMFKRFPSEVDMTIHIGNVSSEISEDFIRTVFSQYGPIINMRFAGIPRRPTRFWFVQYADHRSAVSACQLDRTRIGEREIRVSLARTPRFTLHREPRVPQVPPQFVSPPLPIQFPAYPDLFNVPVMPPQPFIPMFPPPKHLDRSVDRDKIARTIFVDGIGDEYREVDIAYFFCSCGTVTAVRKSKLKGGVNKVWVEFSTKPSADMAIKLSGKYFGGSEIYVSKSQTAICTNKLECPIPSPVLGASFPSLPASSPPSPPGRPRMKMPETPGDRIKRGARYFESPSVKAKRVKTEEG